MKHVNGGDPTVFELRSEVHGCLVLGGLPFFLAGMSTLAFGLGLLPFEPPAVLWERAMVVAFGAVFALVGAVFIGGRHGLFIDRGRHEVISWWGLFTPMKRTVRHLGAFSLVDVSKEERARGSGNKKKVDIFPVRLAGTSGESLTLESPTDYHQARQLGEMVAKFLHWPMSDSSTGEPVVREAEHLDESLRDRLRRLGERIELPSAPHDMHSSVQLDSYQVTVEIPPVGPPVKLYVHLAGSVIVAAIVTFMVGGALITTPMPDGVRIAAIAALVAFFVIVPAFSVFPSFAEAKRSTLVTASTSALTVRIGKEVTEIPCSELEELSLGGRDVGKIFQAQPDGSLMIDSTVFDRSEFSAQSRNGGQTPRIPPQAAGLVKALAGLAGDRLAITARSDTQSVTFGAGLSAAELGYISSALTRIIAG